MRNMRARPPVKQPSVAAACRRKGSFASDVSSGMVAVPSAASFGTAVDTVKYAYRSPPGQTAWRIWPGRNDVSFRAATCTDASVSAVIRQAFPLGSFFQRSGSVGSGASNVPGTQ